MSKSIEEKLRQNMRNALSRTQPYVCPHKVFIDHIPWQPEESCHEGTDEGQNQEYKSHMKNIICDQCLIEALEESF